MLKKKINLLILSILGTSCIQTEDPNAPNLKNKTDQTIKTKVFSTDLPKNYNVKEINHTFSNNLRSLNYIEARTIYKANIEGDFSKTSIVTFQFEGKEKPSLKLYKDELKSGMNINIIPPNHKFKILTVRKLDSKNNVLSEVKMRLESGVENLILI